MMKHKFKVFQKSLTQFFIEKISIENYFLSGFLITFIFFFIKPIFFSGSVMNFPQYIPIIDPIGYDLKQMLSYVESWKIFNETPYIGANLYPPFATVFFSPLLEIKYSRAFKLITLLTIFCFVIISYLLPLLTKKNNKLSGTFMLVFLTGLFSYGFQFELERGQFNIIAMTFSLIAIYIFHTFPKLRLLSYALFTISVQLKVYPFIFILLFVDNWKDIKINIIRFVKFGFLNFALLFILGTKVFFDFFHAIKKQTVNPDIWVGNHSIQSFLSQTRESLIENNSPWLLAKPEVFQIFLFLIIIGCILLLIYFSYKNSNLGFNSSLLLACTIGAMLIPSVSHDYKLSILIAPVMIYISSNLSPFQQILTSNNQKIFGILFVLIFSVAYSSTLFSFTNKPIGMQNNFPALLILLILITTNQIFSKKNILSNPETKILS